MGFHMDTTTRNDTSDREILREFQQEKKEINKMEMDRHVSTKKKKEMEMDPHASTE